MAYVYADMDALAEYQQQIVQTLSTLEGQVGCKEDLIESTKVQIRAAIERAEEAERAAYASLQVAEEQLREAEQRTREYNSNLAEDQEPMTTPEFYYDNVYEKEAEYSYAEATRAHAENTLSSFVSYVRNYEQQQADGIEHFKKLLGVSGKFFEGYIKKLIEVKLCTAVSGGGSSASSKTNKATSSQNDDQSSRPHIVLTGKSVGADGELHDYRTVIYYSDRPSNTPSPFSFGWDSKQIQAWGNKHYSSWLSSLSSQERTAIAKYTGEGDESYSKLNTNLRAGIALNNHERDLVNNIHSALSRAALPHDVQVFRALDDNGIRELALYCNQGNLEAGASLQDSAFMSCSLLANNSFNTRPSNKYILRLSAPQGLHAAYVYRVSTFATEQELLVDKDHSIYITGISKCARKEITQNSWDNDEITVIDGVLSI